jgi:hypothetical protein
LLPDITTELTRFVNGSRLCRRDKPQQQLKVLRKKVTHTALHAQALPNGATGSRTGFGKTGFESGRRVLAILRADGAASANSIAFEVFRALRVVLGAQTRDPSQRQLESGRLRSTLSGGCF